jgi:hypothetical protein
MYPSTNRSPPIEVRTSLRLKNLARHSVIYRRSQFSSSESPVIRSQHYITNNIRRIFIYPALSLSHTLPLSEEFIDNDI